MKVAAYQAPLFENGSMEAIEHIKAQIAVCEDQGVEILCCPETILGGMAEYVENPLGIALNVESGQLKDVLAPLASETVTTIVGFTEITESETLYNSAAVFHTGKVIGIYRKDIPQPIGHFIQQEINCPHLQLDHSHLASSFAMIQIILNQLASLHQKAQPCFLFPQTTNCHLTKQILP